jgi:hypothetical protein
MPPGGEAFDGAQRAGGQVNVFVSQGFQGASEFEHGPMALSQWRTTGSACMDLGFDQCGQKFGSSGGDGIELRAAGGIIDEVGNY